MDDITILKNRLAYFSNRVSYNSDFEEVDYKIDYESEPNYDDEIDVEDYKEYMQKQKEQDFVKKVKQLIRTEQIDLNEIGSKELANLLEISNKEVKQLFPEHYEEFMKEQELVYKMQGKEEQVEQDEKNKIKLGKKMKKLLKDLKKK
jgi:AraC-like DNA-binding protein